MARVGSSYYRPSLSGQISRIGLPIARAIARRTLGLLSVPWMTMETRAGDTLNFLAIAAWVMPFKIRADLISSGVMVGTPL